MLLRCGGPGATVSMTLPCVARVVFFFAARPMPTTTTATKSKDQQRLVTGGSELAQGQVWRDVGRCLIVSPHVGFRRSGEGEGGGKWTVVD